jgi:biopolymer transport protein ExbB
MSKTLLNAFASSYKTLLKSSRLACALLFLLLGPGLVLAVTDLQQLLEQTRTVREREMAEHAEREQRFMENLGQREALLQEARSDLEAQRRRSRDLQTQFDENERKLGEMQTDLENRVGTLGEMFGVVRQVAGDSASLFRDSMISAQLNAREAFVGELAQSRALPSIEELELFWFEMQREMTENGLVKRFQAPIILPDGKEVTKEVVRVGPFTAMSEGRYLAYLPESRKFTELSRQPGSGMMGVAGKLQTETSGYHAAVLDPTRGSLLAVLVQAPSLAESMQYGGLVGYVIMTLAVIGLGLAALRLMRLAVIGRAVAKQRLNIDSPLDTNPLGRVLRSYHDHPDVDNETLQLHLDEAILKEVPKLQAGLSPLKILAAIGPLLGLLGTVTGMIITFQQITLFGTGDPKLMASGISQALVTTVQGLVMSIPLLLLHSFLQSRSKDLIQLLEEETAGIIAMQAEKARLKSLQKQNL